MIYQSQKMKLKSIRVVRKGEVNDILICRDLNTAVGNLYTLLVIKDHRTARKLLEVYEDAGETAKASYVDSFTDQGVFCLAYEYKQERPLADFYMGSSYTLKECEDICIQLILTCMASNLPYPILYLILTQGQIHMSQDQSIYFGYQLDLSELDSTRTERDCAVECAAILRDLLSSKESQKAFSFQLLEKKIARKSYERFTELYKDVRITAVPSKKRGILKKVKAWFMRNQDTLFRILLVICIVLAVITVVSLVMQMIFGDIPWLRIFFNGFKEIGTERLAG